MVINHLLSGMILQVLTTVFFWGDFWWIRSHGMNISPWKITHRLWNMCCENFPTTFWGKSKLMSMLRSWGFTPFWEFPPRAKTNSPQILFGQIPLCSIQDLHLQSPRSPRKNLRKTAARTNLLAEQNLEKMRLKHQLKTKKRTALAFSFHLHEQISVKQ